jgi:DNA-binding transcriptional LysR family regulator
MGAVTRKLDGMAPPSLRELEILRAMIATRKTVAAAQMLSISQPAVSRALAALEERTGRVLFMREAGRLVPTGDAFALEAEAQPIFTAMQRLATWPLGQARASVLKIAAASTLAQFVLPSVIALFGAREGGVQIEIETSSSVIAQVADRAADIGFVDIPVEHPGVRARAFREAVAHVLMPGDHQLAALPELGPRDLADVPLIAVARRFPARIEADRAFAAAGVAPRIVAEGATAIFVAELVRKRIGLALLNPFPLTLGGLDGLVARRFCPTIAYRTMMMFPSAGPITPAAQSFADLLLEWQPEDGLTTAIR